MQSIYNRESEETFIVDLEKEESVKLGGTASAFRIAQNSNYSNDPIIALAEYATRLLAHVNGGQGLGWEIVNNYTGRTLPGCIESIDISRERGAKFEFDYTLSLKVGNGINQYRSLNPETVNPSQTATIAGKDLHEVEQLGISKQTKMRVYTYATPRPVTANGIESKTGAQRDITIRGNIPGDESDRQAFDDEIRSKVGVNETVTLQTAFPGTSYDVVITNFEPTREAGTTQIGGYSIRATEGTTGA